ncbi:MAG: pyruvate kinase [Candidatus Omnitrophica bacterium]|nr:pyruvate kinase [Candidatus Omnitrophota bacterium]
MVKTKIICTIGPASTSKRVLRKMMLAGMDVARLNFSHGSHAEHEERIGLIRGLNAQYRRHIRVLADLEGYRIRVGRLPGKVMELKKRQQVLLTNQEKAAAQNSIPFDYEGPLSDIKAGSLVYIDDGNISLLVKGRAGAYLKAQVVVPGVLKERKGINIPDVRLRFKGLTHKDRLDSEFAIQKKADYIAQSFVRDKEDILALKRFIGKRAPACRIIAKIENREGIRNIDGILDVSDGVMIARGDMGVCLPVYEIPVIQKQIIKKCNQRKKIVITATQMLESMTENPRPTRAEVTDVANAMLDGSDFLMLSAETAAGKFPAESVRMMNQIVKFTEEFAKRKQKA